MSGNALPPHVAAVAPELAYRLLNFGPTVLLSVAHAGRRNVMAAAWNVPLEFKPPRVAVVLDKSTLTRELLLQAGTLVIQVPGAALAETTFAAGSCSGHDLPAGADKLVHCGMPVFEPEMAPAPLVAGCVAWLACRRIAEPHMEQAYDLFVFDVTAAWADSRAFSGGRYRALDEIPAALRPVHHLGAGLFWSPGHAIQAQPARPRT